MSSFKVKHAFTKGSISDEYADVNIHVRDGDNQNIVIKANKVVLAFHSKYFHEVLKHRATSACVDFAFVGVQATVIQRTIDIMYGSKESISVKECRKFKEFFKLLQVDFAEESEDERISLKRGNMEDFSDGPGGKTAKLKEVPSQVGGSCYTRRSGAPANIDNWTETSETDLDINLSNIGFILNKTPVGQHNKYACTNCNFICTSIQEASSHQEAVHLECDTEIGIMKQAMEYRQNAMKEELELKDKISSGCNAELAVNELKTLSENLQFHIEKVRSLDTNNLTTALRNKRRNLDKLLTDSVTDLDQFIANISSL